MRRWKVIHTAGNTVTPEEGESQLMLPSKYRTIKSRVFQTEDEAWLEAERLGHVKRGLE